MTAATMQVECADTNLLGDWLEFVARDGWNFLYWPHWSDPEAVAAYRRWHGFGMTDVLALVHEKFAFAYRALVPDNDEFLAPQDVLYVNEGVKPVHIVRSILTSRARPTREHRMFSRSRLRASLRTSSGSDGAELSVLPVTGHRCRASSCAPTQDPRVTTPLARARHEREVG